MFSNNLNSSPKPYKFFSDAKSVIHEELPPPATEFPHPPIADLKTPSAFTPYRKLNAKFLPKTDNVNNNVPFIKECLNYDKYVESSLPVAGLPVQVTETLSVNEKDTQNNNWCTDVEKVRSSQTENSIPADIIRKFNSQLVVSSPSCEEKNNLIRNSNQFYNDVSAVSNNRNFSSSKSVDGKFVKLANPEAFVAMSSYVSNNPQVSDTLTSASLRRNPKVHFGSTVTYSDDENSELDEQLLHASGTTVTSSHKELGIDCHHCKRIIVPGQVVVVAERAGVEVIWHPQCFVCIKCQVINNPVSLNDFFKSTKVDLTQYQIINCEFIGIASRFSVFFPSR